MTVADSPVQPIAEGRLEKKRVLWVDYAKGLSIFLVVLYHVWNGLEMRPHQIPDQPQLYRTLNDILQTMRMPLFFFVAGLFVISGTRKSSVPFLQEKAKALIWPYLIWTAVYVLILSLGGMQTGDGRDLSLTALPYYWLVRPIAQYWFLYVLFLSLVLFYVLARLNVPRWGMVLLGLGLCLIRLNVDFRIFDMQVAGRLWGPAYWGPLFQTMSYFVFLALGAWLSPALVHRLDAARSGLLVGVMTFSWAVVVGAVVLCGQRWNSTLILGAWILPVGMLWCLVSIAGGVCLAALLTRLPGTGLLRVFGQYSLYIFVMHVIFLAVVRTLLLKADVTDYHMHLVSGMLAGVGGPLLTALAVERRGGRWLFSLR